MANFLSQDEINQLLDIGKLDDDFPYYAEIKENEKYDILTITKELLKDNYDLDIDKQDIYDHNITKKFKEKGIDILRTNSSKTKLVQSMKSDLEEFDKKKDEMEFIKTYLENNPEYVV